MSQQQNRREFVAGVTAAACVTVPVLQGVMGISSLAQAAENATSPATAPSTAPAVPLGWTTTIKPANIKTGAFVDTFAKDHKFILARTGDKVYALDTRCTHKNCPVQTSETDIFCKCHNSHFIADGTPSKGPAKAPLDRHPLRLTAAGIIEVDTSKKLASTDEASVLTITTTA